MLQTIGIMKRLTAKEEEIMGYFWEKGPLFVKQLLEYYEEPKPHFNTLSTIVRGLEDKGFLAHNTLKNVIAKYFNNSYLGVVSSLIKEEEISVNELRQLLDEVEQANKK